MIGELSEKGVHNGLKNYLEPDKSKQEIKVGRYFADIKNDSGIIEIQTKQFFKLKSKLDFYLREEIPVTVVFPLETVRYIVRDYGKRKACHTGIIQDVLYEMYSLLEYLDKDLFSLKIIEVEVNEYRDYDNTKTRRELVKVLKQHTYHNSKEFLYDMIPFDGEFTMKEFKDLGIQRRKLNPLKGLIEQGWVLKVGKNGNSIIYKRLDM